MKRVREDDVIYIDDDGDTKAPRIMDITPISGGGPPQSSRGVGESLYSQLNPKQKAALTRYVKSRSRKKSYGRYRRGYRYRPYSRGGYRGGSSGPISIVQGRGDYTLGGQVGAKIGGYIGDRVHNFVSGLGDYHSSADLYGRLPTMVNNPSGGGTIIRFQEYISDVITGASNTFNITSYILNAGQGNTFPWLSQIASNFEQFQFEGIIFQFRSTSANALNSTNTALGTVIMATQYDTVDNAFSSKAEMLNYEFSASVKPSESCLHMIECAPNQTTIDKLYVLDGSVPPNADPRLYNLGRFSIATSGFQGTNVNIGELHVTYQVRLLKPKLFQTLGSEIDTYYFRYDTTTGVGWDNANVLGLPAAVAAPAMINNIGLVRTGNMLTLPYSSIVKQYMLYIRWRADTGVALTFPSITPSNGLFVSPLEGNPQSGLTSQGATMEIMFRTSGNSIPVLTFGAAGALPTGNVSSLTIALTQVPVF